ncbi:Fe-S cluster assembly scaffold protein NifU [Candidatus Shapirobacteria bacterium CG03_land_8_20_14_0_80_40_19]|uniref:Fe-S cluster assembly scaffold protein NifU n=4 Tax=Candidatus Shapironibacteriota TaxID=1752721 RepID=A0A2M7BCK9_9BACT|nr:MAG: Fe-S cluster assembly scaffold protein NifU [Candidatus Shapirobacteria bacterium CG11_big_fil_rev_8_21_14_0_20_40_12]PIV00841.1 MAG: Fe-S cluster assembly scaffold protein NifU [Candidatus Shapirobacteria bacterium CG03_land_8_20_14_0_80_40_19]PJC29110.1 MAG: Fe-S cluster assembly scaffold protein NifU [Candidatus Shapirobacteria bacterium CG_4_9_14_0_2_um_filter_40_11]PJC77029.1 MAG: Fe-S cluster assembly scaffold protein NifU [Candidatus Shapirobacteria bacterium CG_4_8_14_3_um_filter
MNQLYSEKVMDHFLHPRNMGELPGANGVATVGNKQCGDVMKMYLKIEGETVKEAKFQTLGCGAAISTSSMATEMIKGKPLSDALKLTNQAIAEALDGLPSSKIHCSVLAAEAVKRAIEDYRSKGEGGK